MPTDTIIEEGFETSTVFKIFYQKETAMIKEDSSQPIMSDEGEL